MRVVWVSAIAFWGLVALVVPIAIHLLARQNAPRIEFPSLRFLRPTRLAALRSRMLSDWPLLLTRLGILALAVAALAGPVFVSPARRAEWDQRVARAIVSVSRDESAAAQTLVGEERASAFVSEVFATRDATNAVADAALWFARQPPALRELVVIGDLRAGDLGAGDLERLPQSTGIRFLPSLANDSRADLDLQSVSDSASAKTEPLTVRVSPGESSTTVSYDSAPAPLQWITVQAPPAEQPSADATLRAVLAEGLLIGRHPERRVVVMFDGATPSEGVTAPATEWMTRALERVAGVRGTERDGTLHVHAGMTATDLRAAGVVQQLAQAAFEDSLQDREPVRISAATIARWSRPPTGVTETRIQDEGDRRWLWAAALALLACEHLLRRRRTPGHAEVIPRDSEARVA